MVEKYDIIGKSYNTTRKADPYITQRIIHYLSPTNTNTYLDIGCGTGNYTSALSAKGVKMIGVEPSNNMLSFAKKRTNDIQWLKGKAEKIPLEDEAVGGIIATLTIHHWKDRTKAFKELHRVLKPKEIIVIFTSTPEQMKGYWLNHYFPEMLNHSILQMPSLESVANDLHRANFEIQSTELYSIQKDLQDLFLYAGKNNPKLYLNKQVREGISSFSSIANVREVALGLKKLSEDIHTGKINEVISTYENNTGDYLFVIAKKN